MVSETTPALSYPKIKVPLAGHDGNAFAIIARCIAAMRRAGISPEERETFRSEAMSGDYNHLLQTVMAYFDTEPEYGEDD